MIKNLKTSINFLPLLLVGGLLFGVQISESMATKVARGVFVENQNLHGQEFFSVANIEKIKDGDNELIYIFHLYPRGFILVPAYDQAVPNLAYGFDYNFDSSNMPPNLNGLMDQYKLEIKSFKEVSSDPVQEISDKWNYYLNSEVQPNRDRDVSPLLGAEFNQSGSWNNALAGAFGFNGPVGCVAVAMCQVMHYWGYPENGVGSNYYTENDYGYLEADFEDAFYDFDNMAGTYATTSSQLLLYHAGISVNMDYDYSGSGAQVVGSYPSAFYSMENFFSYSDEMSYYWKDSFTDTEYRNIIKNELDFNRPLIAQGFDNGGYGGHAWNIDGYSGNNLHCNWGWGGSSNGYFNLTSMGGFPNDQAVIAKIIPATYTNPLALYEFSINDLTVSFDDLSTVINEVQVNSWLWDFGDGATSFSQSPSHTYNSGGYYEVSLKVTNIYGQESEAHLESISLNMGLMGDVNGDDIINILDIVMIANFVLGSDSPSDNEFSSSDLNSDGMLNILDVVTLANLILGN